MNTRAAAPTSPTDLTPCPPSARLDAIIARKMELEPPPVETVAICGALLKAHLAVNATTERLTKEFVGRNAAPPPDLLTSLVELKVDFIWNGIKFTFEVYRHSAELGNCETEV